MGGGLAVLKRVLILQKKNNELKKNAILDAIP